MLICCTRCFLSCSSKVFVQESSGSCSTPRLKLFLKTICTATHGLVLFLQIARLLSYSFSIRVNMLFLIWNMLFQVKTRLALQMRNSLKGEKETSLNMPEIRFQTSNIILSFLGCFFRAPNQSGSRRAAGNWALAYRNVLNQTFHRKKSGTPEAKE